MCRSSRGAMIVAAACGCASTAVAQFDSSVWPGFRGTATKRGAVAAAGPATNLAFSTAVPNFGTCTPGGFTIAANGDIYFKAYSTTNSKVYRLNPANGAVLGSSIDFAGTAGNYGGVAVGVDAVYVCIYNGAGATSIQKLDRSTLAVITSFTNAAWQGFRGTPLIGSVLNNAGHVNLYVADRNGNMIYAVDSVTGALMGSFTPLYPAILGQLGPMWTTNDGKQAFAHFGNGNFGPGEALKDNGDGTLTPLWQLAGPGNFNWWGCGALGTAGDRIYVTTFHDPILPDPAFTDSMWCVSLADGSVIWHAGLPDGNHFGRPAVIGRRIYAGNGGGSVYCYEDQDVSATIEWIYTNADPGEFTSVSAVLTPSGDKYIYAIQQETTTMGGRLVVLKDLGSSAQVTLDTTLNGTMRWSLFSNCSGTIDAQGSLWVCGGRVDDPTPGTVYKFAVGGATCYPNCDGSTTPPILNVADFSCFLNEFAAGDSHANCDNSTTPPVLNVADFSCFLNAFAAGCS
jgi:hypothetical protein